MIVHCFLESSMAESDPLYVFLPLALAGFATAIIFGVQWLVGGFSRSRPRFPAAPITLKRSNSMKQIFHTQWRSLFLRVFAVLALGAVVFHASPTHAATEAAARVVKYSKEDIVPVRAKLRFSTLIVLPEDEEILDFTTGDKEFWVINGAHNLCYVHPAQAGIRSNLNLITASGHVYSFLLTEISNQPNAEPDLKIFVEPKEGSGIAANTGLRGYVSAGEAEAYKKELESLRSQTADQIHAAQAQSAEQLNHFRSSYANKTPIRLPPRRESGARAVPGLRHLPRRLVHLHQVRRARKARSV